MSEKYLEENRYLYIESRLGENELLLESFTGSEAMSQLFHFQLELLSENKRIKFEDILGQEISFGVQGAEEGATPRCIHGIVTAFAQLPDAIRLSRYRAIVSPKLWILTQKQNCRIFQNLNVPDILKKVLAGIDVTWELQGSYQPREYCVQYRETDFNFISRLMEEEGIFYFFRFTKDSHKMIISDNKASHQDMPGNASLIYEEVAGGYRDETRISSWVKTQELSPGKFSLQDFNFTTPQTNLMTGQDILPAAMVGKINHKLKVGGNDQYEIYDYPGRYDNKGSGKDIAKHAMEQIELSQFVIHGDSNVFNLTPGYKFTLTRHPHAEGSYVMTLVTHSAAEGGFHSSADIGKNHYANNFRAVPYSLQFRPPRTSAKPHVWGCQTAIVVGPSGEEIYTDGYGRVKVQFHWDRDGQKNESSSCWIRVATHWAGRQWGAIHLPRISHEVVVDFLEGDPDRPIIVGAVYNANNMPPYMLPANKTQSGIKSDSSRGGGGYNQMRFEDVKGREEVLIHAQKDMNTTVENDETWTVKHNETIDVTNDRTKKIGHNDSATVGNNMSITVKNDETIDVTNNRTTKIGKDDKTTVMNNMNVTIQKDRTTTIMGGDSETVMKDSTVKIIGSESRTIATRRSVTIGSTDSLTAGGTISITAAGVTITAPTITLNAGMVQVSGIVQCTNLIASAAVVSPSYTPGAGNIL